MRKELRPGEGGAHLYIPAADSFREVPSLLLSALASWIFRSVKALALSLFAREPHH